MLVAELVCQGCSRILCYPYGAISCKCRRCGIITPAQYTTFECGGCQTPTVVPINTLVALCPVCATVTDIPEQYLPITTSHSRGGGSRGIVPILHDDVEDGQDLTSKTIYVSYDEPKKRKKKKARASADQSNPLAVGSESPLPEETGGGTAARHAVMLIGKRIV